MENGGGGRIPGGGSWVGKRGTRPRTALPAILISAHCCPPGLLPKVFFFFPSPKVFGCEDCDSFVVGFFFSSLNRGSCQDIKEHKLIKGALVKQRTTEGHHATVSTANLLWISLQAVSYGFRQYICLFLQTHAALCSVLPTYCGKLYTVPCY